MRQICVRSFLGSVVKSVIFDSVFNFSLLVLLLDWNIGFWWMLVGGSFVFLD